MMVQQNLATHSALKSVINLLIYLSVALGFLLSIQLFRIVPEWLFYSALAGWVVYLIAALGAATGHRAAYPLVLVLSVLTLIVSLPQPAHYAILGSGYSLSAFTFVAGSVTQISLLILIPTYFVATKQVKG